MTIIAVGDDWSRVSHAREERDWSKVSPREERDWSKVSPREERDWSKVSPREERDWSKVSPREERDWLMWAYFGLTLAQSVGCSRCMLCDTDNPSSNPPSAKFFFSLFKSQFVSERHLFSIKMKEIIQKLKINIL